MTQQRSRTSKVDAVHALPMQQLNDHHEMAGALCVDLERLADGLPGLPPPHRLRRLLARLELLVDVHFGQVEALLQRLSEPQRPDPEVLSQLWAMHVMDADHARDVVTALWDFALGRPGSDPARIGYMLRCLFEGCRRSMALEHALLRVATAVQRG